ncbi:hypothetical protein NL526_29045, partial [Klebsiella pneumoniae]|nr:hypothetical protein [Klebsiella pneumoniae]
VDANRYDLSVLDMLGRAVWKLAARAEGGLLTDLRAERYCRLHGDVALPWRALPMLPVGGVPRLLAGRLPVPLVADGRREGGPAG